MRGTLRVLLASSLVAAVVGLGAPPATAQEAPAPNPPIEESCGVETTLVLDASGSISSSGAVEQVRDAADAFLSALADTNSSARVTQFATVSGQLAPSTLVTAASLADGGVHRDALNGYYDPKPPRPPNALIKRYDGSGNPLSAGNYATANSDIQYTNWDQGLDEAGTTTPEIVLFVTDGDPTAFDFDQPGDPFDPGPPPDMAVRTDGSAEGRAVTLERAVEEANQIKAGGTRMLAVGVGAALSNPASVDRLVQVAGPQVVRDTDLRLIDSINDVDVALVTEFDDLAAFLRGVVLQLCSPSLTIRKLAQTPDDPAYAPAAGWDMTVTPSVPLGDGFRWILPDAAPAVSKTVATNADGFAQFQWEPDPPEADSRAEVAETLRPGYIAGRPDGNDFRCELRDEDGNVRVVAGDFAGPANPEFVLDPIGQEIVACAVFNSFDYAPAIALTKVNTPTEVRGDLDPPATVTSAYEATNPGNTPLSDVAITDDQCGLVVPVPSSGPNQGDVAPANGKLDPGEAWSFTCDRLVSSPASTDELGLTIVNEAVVVGVDPEGTVVDATATDDVAAFNPAVEVTKLVDGVDAVTVPLGQTVTYTYAVSNAGNTPLGSVTLTDDTPPCEAPVRGPDAPGNDDDVLELGEVWTFSCLAVAQVDVINTATVTGVPLNPVQGNAPFPDPNPVVTGTDLAEVRVVNPAIVLTKAVTPDVVLLGPGSPTPPEPVAYTFTAQNPGDAPLNRPGATTGGPAATDPGWIEDARCTAPATFVTGDDDGDALLDPGETWEFGCPGAVTAPTVNVARIVGQPSDDAGQPLPGIGTVQDLGAAFVDVLRPGISVNKIALRGVVLDPGAAAVEGPDVPTRRPAEYVYDVVNTGNVPLSLTDDPPVDDTCGPLDFVPGGDSTNTGFLDPGEVWEYTCATTLDRDQANTPPNPGDLSGLVQNRIEVTGVPQFEGEARPDKAVTDSDIAQVLVIEPSLTLTKTASADVVRVGDEVTYTVVVANTGDVGLGLQEPVDTTCAPLEFVDGDDNGNGLLDGANSDAPESWTYTCTRALGLPEAPDLVDTNTATVRGFDPLGNAYDASDTAEVRVLDPAIDLTKTVSEALVPVGTEVTYGFAVTNVGQSPVAADDLLAEVTLVDVSVPDVPACLRPVLVAKEGGNQDDFLDREPPEVWRYQCQATISEPTTNVALVDALGGTQFGLELPVIDLDAAFVQPFSPGIDVVKTATPTVLLGSGEVTYTYEVTNTGDVPLAGVAENIADDTCAPVTYVSGDLDDDGLLDTSRSIFEDSGDETWLFTCTTTVDRTTTNTVVTPATPVDPGGEPLCGVTDETAGRVSEPCDVTDSAQATVRVVVPGSITITKRTRPASSQPFGFSMGDESFELSHDDAQVFDGLAPGTYVVTEEAQPGWLLAGVTCQDPSGDTTTDPTTGAATVELAEGESVICTFVNAEIPDVAPPPDLPDTGAQSIGQLLLMGLTLLVLGSAAVAYRSRLA